MPIYKQTLVLSQTHELAYIQPHNHQLFNTGSAGFGNFSCTIHLY